MPFSLSSHTDPITRRPAADPLPCAGSRQTAPEPHEDSARALQFAAMVKAFEPRLGIASANDAVLRLQQHTDQPVSMLAHWIVDRKLVAFTWRSQTWLPLFQFQLSDMSLCEPVVQVVRELSDVLDDWDLALWFALPNHWLHQATPVDTIERDQPAVLQAARAERYVARW